MCEDGTKRKSQLENAMAHLDSGRSLPIGSDIKPERNKPSPMVRTECIPYALIHLRLWRCRSADRQTAPARTPWTTLRVAHIPTGPADGRGDGSRSSRSLEAPTSGSAATEPCCDRRFIPLPMHRPGARSMPAAAIACLGALVPLRAAALSLTTARSASATYLSSSSSRAFWVHRRSFPKASRMKSIDEVVGVCSRPFILEGHTSETTARPPQSKRSASAPYFSSSSSSAFCVCSLFSASSKTADCGPSMTASLISSPRCAGRQWRTMALGEARRRSVSSSWKP